MLLSLYNGDWEYWQLYHSCTFDGENKLIIINPGVTELQVKTEIYSDWKEWTLQKDNAKYPAAIRVTGGDPIGGGSFTGDVYFMINGWRILVSESCQINGVIYSDDFPSPFYTEVSTKVITNKVAAIVTVVEPDLTSLQIPSAVENAQQVWEYLTRTLTSSPGYTGPTAEDIRVEIETNQTTIATAVAIAALPSAVDNATAVRAELSTELAHVLTLQNGSLTAPQANMLLEMYNLLGLDPTKPLIVTETSRTAGDISQTIATSPSETIVTRN